MGFFSKIGEGLRKTRESLMGTVNSMLKSFTRIDEELFEELEEILIGMCQSKYRTLQLL